MDQPRPRSCAGETAAAGRAPAEGPPRSLPEVELRPAAVRDRGGRGRRAAGRVQRSAFAPLMKAARDTRNPRLAHGARKTEVAWARVPPTAGPGVGRTNCGESWTADRPRPSRPTRRAGRQRSVRRPPSRAAEAASRRGGGGDPMTALSGSSGCWARHQTRRGTAGACWTRLTRAYLNARKRGSSAHDPGPTGRMRGGPGSAGERGGTR